MTAAMQPVQSTSAQQDSSRTLKQRTPQEIPHPLAVFSSVQTSPASAQVDMKCQGQGTPPLAIMRRAAQNNVDTTCASLVGMPTPPRLWSSVKLPQSAASKLVRSTTALATGRIPPMLQNLHATLSPQRHAAKLLAPVTLAATVGCRTKRTRSWLARAIRLAAAGLASRTPAPPATGRGTVLQSMGLLQNPTTFAVSQKDVQPLTT